DYRNRWSIKQIVNGMIELADIRPRFLWEESAPRPKLIYSSEHLFSYLVLQFCLRLVKLDSFAFCSGCFCEYTPTVRAPKSNQRNFCDACKQKKIPQRMAYQDYRKRK